MFRFDVIAGDGTGKIKKKEGKSYVKQEVFR